MKVLVEMFTMFSKMVNLLRSLLKGYLLNLYIHLVDGVRSIFFTAILAILCLLLLVSGFILLHVALFLYFPWEMSTRITVLAILGGIYLIAPLIILGRLQSRGYWLKITRAQQMLDDLSAKK